MSEPVQCPTCKSRIKVRVEGNTALFLCPTCKVEASTWVEEIEEDDGYDQLKEDRREIDSLRYQ